MEIKILSAIRFEFGFITPESFAKIFILSNKQSFQNDEVRAMARFVMELSLFHSIFLNFKQSVIAESSLLLAHQIIVGSDPSGDSQCISLLIRSLMRAPPAIFRKYMNSDFCHASQRAQAWYRTQIQGHYASQLFSSGQLTPPADSPATFEWDVETVRVSFYNSYNSL
jgi:hypothetical protein